MNHFKRGLLRRVAFALLTQVGANGIRQLSQREGGVFTEVGIKIRNRNSVGEQVFGANCIRQLSQREGGGFTEVGIKSGTGTV